MKLIKRIICAVVGHKEWHNEPKFYVRDGRRFKRSLFRSALCQRCDETLLR